MTRILKRPSDIQEPVINITPLIDVVFVVLIAFILVAPLLNRDQVQLASGAASSQTQLSMKEASPIQIHVRANNIIVLCGTAIASTELFERLSALKKQYPYAKPQVFHDRRAHFGTYQTLKNYLEQLGFEEMDIVLSPHEG